jgi:predicted phage terminase large subunit-like protein
VAPTWFAPYGELLDGAVGSGHDVVVAAPPQHGKPLCEDTLVTMGDGGLRRIGDVRVGDSVVSGAGRVTTVTNVFDQGLLQVLRIRTRGGREILAEGSHRFLTQPTPPGSKRRARGGWKRADDLRVYDRATDERGDGLVVLAGYATGCTPMPEAEARFLGYMVGDGCARHRSPSWTNIDPDVRAEFERVVEALGGNVVASDAQSLRVNSGHGRANGHHLRDLLERHGVQGKLSWNKVVPEAVMRADVVAVAAFLAAYFECDGTKTAGQSASFSSVSKRLLIDVQHLLARLGVRSSLRIKNGRYRGKPHTSWRLSVYDEERFFAAVPIVGKKSRVKPYGLRGQPLRDNGWMFDTIVSIEPAGERRCYCITVADDESFLAEGCVTHNTVLTVAGLVRWLIRRPDLRFAYATYNMDRAYSIARDTRAVAHRVGLELSGPINAPRTPSGGGIVFVGRGTGLTGEPINGFGVIDDPFKDAIEANSKPNRDAADEWHRKVWTTRLHPGASQFLMATRWHIDDLSGRRVKEGARYLNIPAIAEGLDPLGREPRQALSPYWPIGELRKKQHRLRLSDFSAMYQGRPVAEDEKLFHAPGRYDDFPAGLPFRVGIGIDLAYSSKTHSDWSAIVVVKAIDVGEDSLYYVAEVHRMQCKLPAFVDRLDDVLRRHPGVKARWYRGGFEQGLDQFLPGVTAIVANQDKIIRSAGVSREWNAGKVLVPLSGGWVTDFLTETDSFTGLGDEHDDQVDALAAAFDSVAVVAGVSKPFWMMAEQSVWGG